LYLFRHAKASQAAGRKEVVSFTKREGGKPDGAPNAPASAM